MNRLPEIVIVDDHDIFRDGLSSLITLKGLGKVVGEAANGEELLNILKLLKPDLVLMDVSMPIMDGIIATKKAIEMHPDLNILALTMFGDSEYYVNMVNAGVKGFVLKSSSKEDLENAIITVSKGGGYFSTELLRKALVKLSSTKTNYKDVFTKREFEILKLLCAGNSANEIAEILHLSKKTIEGHRTKLFNKTGTKSSVALVIFAMKNQIVDF